jgi:hypothetical protein
MLASLFAVRRSGDVAPLAGVSWRALELNLLASVSRAYFQWATHFYEHWLACCEITLSILSLAALVAALNSSAAVERARPSESFPAGSAVLACLAPAAVVVAFDAGGMAYTSLAFSVFLEVRMARVRPRACSALDARALASDHAGATARRRWRPWSHSVARSRARGACPPPRPTRSRSSCSLARLGW